ncbi:hypothetical protein EI42_04851 [Thermosporothrix hazakensis]|jgi:hypothetical protein|uniref:CcmD family protein n=2 Tax=Thermosporothrix TaxID=768650 RepID=A0A326U0K2_THEHA|nr:hypothetical protein [Thermosporothrix hazakensis]PZW23926.1 hypothetical protein EI42_04851 [Thermosporothrix hazakensis]BBH90438.1 hypothetical protein KTC_51890 [Thermosporothrix sp. COM3]GCE48475.1 hypothetical protein KTH_33440 [Thermosporothrix hazakensis]
MNGFTYMMLAYALGWLILMAYVVVIALRLRGARTELAAVEELVREQQEQEE